jgi:hypothetical protein
MSRAGISSVIRLSYLRRALARRPRLTLTSRSLPLQPRASLALSSKARCKVPKANHLEETYRRPHSRVCCPSPGGSLLGCGRRQSRPIAAAGGHRKSHRCNYQVVVINLPLGGRDSVAQTAVVVAALTVICHLSLVVGVAPGGVGDVKREGWLAEDWREACTLGSSWRSTSRPSISYMAMPMMPC